MRVAQLCAAGDSDGFRGTVSDPVRVRTPQNITGGAIAYVKWAHAAGERGPNGEPLRHREDFFVSQYCRDWFKKFVEKMLTRRNTVTGLEYRDDPAIFAWELINEPRVQGDATGDILQEWIEEMASYAKTLDQRHMLTVGLEGFYGVSEPSRAADENPVGGAEQMGGDYTRNFYVPEIDFACIHLWVDLWLFCDEQCKSRFADRWIAGHLEVSRDRFNKPVLLEEFGKWKPLQERDDFFKKAFEVSLPPSSPVSSHAGGSMFWHMDPTAYPYNEDGFTVQAQVDTTTAAIVRGAYQAATATRDASGAASPSTSTAPRPSRPSRPSRPYGSPRKAVQGEADANVSSPPVYRSPSSHGAGTSAPGAIPRYRFESVPSSDAPSRGEARPDADPEG